MSRVWNELFDGSTENGTNVETLSNMEKGGLDEGFKRKYN